MLSDDEAEEIRRKVADGWRGPVPLNWFEQIVRDREERRQQTLSRLKMR